MFIYDDVIENTSICDELITYYNNSKDKIEGGVCTSTENFVLNEKLKKCTEVFCSDFSEPIINLYLHDLSKLITTYTDKFKHSTDFGGIGITTKIKIQAYKPNEAFYGWHSERGPSELKRVLVFMTYLNDVTDGGETEFLYQNIKIAPKKGRTLIWPADWTHTHRGITSPTQDKYIITGWINFVQ
jgi:hypothetical protein